MEGGRACPSPSAVPLLAIERPAASSEGDAPSVRTAVHWRSCAEAASVWPARSSGRCGGRMRWVGCVSRHMKVVSVRTWQALRVPAQQSMSAPSGSIVVDLVPDYDRSGQTLSPARADAPSPHCPAGLTRSQETPVLASPAAMQQEHRAAAHISPALLCCCCARLLSSCAGSLVLIRRLCCMRTAQSRSSRRQRHCRALHGDSNRDSASAKASSPTMSSYGFTAALNMGWMSIAV